MTDDMTKPIEVGKYRATRSYLSDEAFALVDGPSEPPNDVVTERDWGGLTTLPTDVLLRTTDYFGSEVADMLAQANAWIFALPDETSKMPFMFEVALDNNDEFEAALFTAAHGWYRQATAGLRNALETTAHATSYALRSDHRGFADWRSGRVEPKFGNSLDLISRNPQVASNEAALGGSALFGRGPNGVMRDIYKDVCRYAHSQPGYTSGDIWQSNGPVFVPRAFQQFWFDYRDVVIACYILTKLAYPPLLLPKEARSIASTAGRSWHGLAPRTIALYFPS